jgi:uncharacterized protein (DUF1810 family)
MNLRLDRFLTAQKEGTYTTALEEIHNGRKESHWMWFIFPQLVGLGKSSIAKTYALADLQEARDYLAHPILGPRLIECTRAVWERPEPITEIFGHPDHLKFRSCMTLFAQASEAGSLFHIALHEKCNNTPDAMTLQLLDS